MPKKTIRSKGSVVTVDTRKLDEVVKLMNDAGASSITFGIHASEETRNDSGPSNVLIGSVHEFGSPTQNIPERSFLRSTTKYKAESWLDKAKQAAKAVYGKQRMTARIAIDRLALLIESDVKKTFAESGGPESWPPPKHRDGKPLMDTGQLRDSIKAVVNEPV